jgi:hypothetical protein
MTTFLLVLMTLLLIAALERNHRRQAPRPPGPIGTYHRDDRDWARIQLDLLALDSQPRSDTARRDRPRHA